MPRAFATACYNSTAVGNYQNTGTQSDISVAPGPWAPVCLSASGSMWLAATPERVLTRGNVWGITNAHKSPWYSQHAWKSQEVVYSLPRARPETHRAGRKWCKAVEFTPGKSTGCGARKIAFSRATGCGAVPRLPPREAAPVGAATCSARSVPHVVRVPPFPASELGARRPGNQGMDFRIKPHAKGTQNQGERPTRARPVHPQLPLLCAALVPRPEGLGHRVHRKWSRDGQDDILHEHEPACACWAF
jgi:hypothetical protein